MDLLGALLVPSNLHTQLERIGSIFSYEVNGLDLRSFDNMNLYKPLPNIEVFKNALMYKGNELQILIILKMYTKLKDVFLVNLFIYTHIFYFICMPTPSHL